jgi:signal transduction histidine kinase
MLVISVKDTGIGIEQESISKLFKIFGKLKQSHSINSGGVGLGLNICKKLCEAMGGYITV